MNRNDIYGVGQFLIDYPGMSIAPTRETSMILRGIFSFSAHWKSLPPIQDSYRLQIEISVGFPHDIPKVTELDGKIPLLPDGKFHVNPDKTLCLGSPIRLLQLISIKPNMVGFAECCLVPYLYGVSNKLKGSGVFPFGELAHGNKGIIDDYMELFGLKTRDQVINTIQLLAKKRKVANKEPCPCGCGLRLGRCSFNKTINEFRNLASRSWYRDQINSFKLEEEYYKDKMP